MARQRNEEADKDEILGDEGSDLRVYELGFHLDPELPVEEVKKAYQAIRNIIIEKGTVVVENEPEKIQLAYTISRQEVAGRRDFESAYFSWIVYEMPAEHHVSVLRAVGADKRVIRFIDLSTTKDAARHFVEMREISKKTPEHAEDAETVPGAELDAVLETVTI